MRRAREGVQDRADEAVTPARLPPPRRPEDGVLDLQRAIGNTAVTEALSTGRFPGARKSPAHLARIPIVAGPGGAPAAAVPTVAGPTGDAAQDLAAAETFHASGIRGPQAIQSTSGIGGFSASYSPASNTLKVIIKGSVVFTDGITGAAGGNPATPGAFLAGDPGLAPVLTRIPPPGPRQTAFLAGFKWQGSEHAAFIKNLEQTIEKAWTGKHEFHVNRPQWEWIGAKVVVDLQIRKQAATGRAADDHFSINTVKTPKEGTGTNNLQPGEQVNSQVAGDGNRANAFDQNMTLSSQDIRPSRNALLQTVPVQFAHDSDVIPAGEKAKIAAFVGVWQGAAAGTAGSRPAHIELRGFTTASGSAQHNRDLAQRRAAAVGVELAAQGLTGVGTRVTTKPVGEAQSGGSESAALRRVDMVPDGGKSQTVAVHEFGHAFGLDDEYDQSFGPPPPGTPRPSAGTATGHDAATKKMTDASGANLPGAVVENNDNIMSVGNAVRPQHYSTFHEALRAITGIEDWALGPKQKKPPAPAKKPAAAAAGTP